MRFDRCVKERLMEVKAAAVCLYVSKTTSLVPYMTQQDDGWTLTRHEENRRQTDGGSFSL